ncbi:hypothetical protein [Sulfitobacter sabulilitoris]|uniref:hypothetical protein n=1 Tax=Sulfitobacter sabulilitoris TaxID=2562655 RepID=UPI001FE5FC1A|nr:hypothetical protein [Sulfitobacter sabulilitoris]
MFEFGEKHLRALPLHQAAALYLRIFHPPRPTVELIEVEKDKHDPVFALRQLCAPDFAVQRLAACRPEIHAARPGGAPVQDFLKKKQHALKRVVEERDEGPTIQRGRLEQMHGLRVGRRDPVMLKIEDQRRRNVQPNQ